MRNKNHAMYMMLHEEQRKKQKSGKRNVVISLATCFVQLRFLCQFPYMFINAYFIVRPVPVLVPKRTCIAFR